MFGAGKPARRSTEGRVFDLLPSLCADRAWDLRVLACEVHERLCAAPDPARHATRPPPTCCARLVAATVTRLARLGLLRRSDEGYRWAGASLPTLVRLPLQVVPPLEPEDLQRPAPIRR